MFFISRVNRPGRSQPARRSTGTRGSNIGPTAPPVGQLPPPSIFCRVHLTQVHAKDHAEWKSRAFCGPEEGTGRSWPFSERLIRRMNDLNPLYYA